MNKCGLSLGGGGEQADGKQGLFLVVGEGDEGTEER